MVSLNEFRNHVIGDKDMIFFNCAAAGPLPDVAKAKELEIIQLKEKGELLLEIHDSFLKERQEIAKLINCTPVDIAPTNSTGDGISSILTSINWNETKEKGIVINDMEYTSNSFPYQQISKMFKLPFHVVPSKINGASKIETVDVEGIIEMIREDNTIGLIGISSVQFINGYRTNLKYLIQKAHEYDVKVLIDGIQSLGAFDFDVKNLDVDYMATGGYKWILGPHGTGFIYINPKLVDSLTPLHVGEVSDEKSLDFRHHIFRPNQKTLKFWGVLNPHFASMGVCVKLINDVGINNIEHRIIELTDYLVNEITSKLKMARIESLRGEFSSGIVRIVFDTSLDLEKILLEIKEKYKIFTVVRSGAFRVSIHAYNTEEDIDTFVKVLQEYFN